MIRKNFLILVVILILITSNVFLGLGWLLCRQDSQIMRRQFQVQQVNGKVLTFAKLFMAKVLNGDKEVGFEDRLQLENAVRDLGDKEILAQWQKFTNSRDAAQIQAEVRKLLDMFFSKVIY